MLLDFPSMMIQSIDRDHEAAQLGASAANRRRRILASILANIGMLLQLVGLASLPCAIVLNLAAGGDSFEFGVSNVLVVMVGGLAIFYLGWIIRGYAENSPGDDDDDEEPAKRKKKKKK